MSFCRKLSPLECYFVDDVDSHSFMVNQYVLEGLGELSLMEWRSAVEEAAKHNPGVRLRLRGFWGGRHWDTDGEYPRVIKVNSTWSGDSDLGAEFHGAALNCRVGPCAEVVLIESGEPHLSRVVFRTHHALMDGNATLYWIHEVFRALRNEPLLGSESDQNEWELAKKTASPDYAIETKPWLNVPPKVFNGSSKNEIGPDISGCNWIAIKSECNVARVLPRLIKCLSDMARENDPEGSVIFRIPSDLRRLLPSEQSYQLGNMVGALDLEIFDHEEANDIYKKILAGVFKKADLSIYPKNLALVNWMPRSSFKPNPKHLKRLRKEDRCDLSGTVTHMGKIENKNLSYPDFRLTRIFAIPVPLEGVSVSIVLIESENGLNICLSVPRALASRDDLVQLTKNIELVLVQSGK